MSNKPMKTVGIVGARGHTGAELIRLIAGHPRLELAFVSSRELAGQPVAAQIPAYRGALRYENLDPAGAASRGADAVVLALPNGHAAGWVAAFDAQAPLTVIVDLSADYRFDAAWYYGLPELTRTRYAGQRRISNPGCYATAMQLAIARLGAKQDGVLRGHMRHNDGSVRDSVVFSILDHEWPAVRSNLRTRLAQHDATVAAPAGSGTP